MKRVLIFIVLAVFLINFISAPSDYINPNPDSSGPVDADVQKIQDATSNIPLDENGEVNKTAIIGWKTKAELRIDAINKALESTDSWFGKMFGINIRLSWAFGYLFFLLLLSLSLFHNIPLWMGNNKEGVNILVGFGATLLLGFFKVFQKIVEFIIKITNKWWWDLLVIAIIIIGIFVLGALAVSAKKANIKKAEDSLVETSKRAKSRTEEIEDTAKALEEGLED